MSYGLHRLDEWAIRYVGKMGFPVAQALLPDGMINFALDRAHEGLANTECDVLCSVIR